MTEIQQTPLPSNSEVPTSPPANSSSPPAEEPHHSDSTAVTVPEPHHEPTATSPSTTPTPQQQPPSQHYELPGDLDPRIAPLLSIFPTLEPSIIQTVFESVGGDHDRAVDVLLGMTDPNHVTHPQSAPTQVDLDEQLAQRLMLEETEAQQYQESRGRGRGVPYQARTNAPNRSGQQQQQGQGASIQDQFRDFISGGPRNRAQQPQQQQQQQDGGVYGSGRGGRGATGPPAGTGDFQEQLSKFADTSKKTFNSIFSKVREKIKEFDKPADPSQQGGTGYTEVSYGGPQDASQQQQYQSYHQQGAAPPQTQGYAVGEQPYPGYSVNFPQGSDEPHVGGSMTPPPPRTNTGFPGTGTNAASSNVAPPAANVDKARLGFLPKKPVSLVDNNPAPANAAARREEDEESLEYVENPFEERH